ncbi:hypothetical protein H5410_051024 [Solanum commersonii]|uniref:Uncharacterized protein n=1 Tax=Solanum commersonii TaxID=4109 RepID=A0A9J5WYS0_SOLCO|nr:hypothetical protein H5410_051024 [Solanum commersonii]
MDGYDLPIQGYQGKVPHYARPRYNGKHLTYASPSYSRKGTIDQSKLSLYADHSASLIRIADQLGDSPFGVVHRRLAPAFSIFMLWVIWRHGTASQDFSAKRPAPLLVRLEPFLQGSAH